MLLRYLYPVLVAVAALLLGMVARRAYYQIKPLLPRRFRLCMRRILATRQRRKNQHTWPVYEPAGEAPKDWPGWPHGCTFALVLTHDVESQEGLDRVKQVAELEMSLGFRSAFNFIPEGPYRVPDELRQWLTERGFEVGVHDHRHDGKLFQSLDRFRASAQSINHYLRVWDAVGFRAGFMLRNLDWIHELDVRYDSSTFDTDPFEPQPEGAHTIFPFWVGSYERGYVELPYTLVQDSTLFLLLREASIRIWQDKLAWIASRGGMALLNVHPDYLAFDRAQATWGEYPAAHYCQFLEWVKQAHAGQFWAALPREVAAHYLDALRRRAPTPDVVTGSAEWSAVPLFNKLGSSTSSGTDEKTHSNR